MPYVTNQGVRIHYDVDGSGPPLVLQHGWTFNNELWYRFGYVDALKPHHRLVLIDARGHGASEKPHDRAAYAWPVNIDDTLAVLDDLGIAKAAFWGYSMGGAIALGLAQHAPHRVSALIVGGATAYPRSLWTFPDGNNPDAFISWLETTLNVSVSSEFRALLLSSDLRALAAAAQDRPSMWTACRRCACLACFTPEKTTAFLPMPVPPLSEYRTRLSSRCPASIIRKRSSVPLISSCRTS